MLLGMGFPEIFLIVLMLGACALSLFILYWIIRKAVRDGIKDSRVSNEVVNPGIHRNNGE